MCLALASITMMFIGLSSAYIVREGLDPDWRAIPLPPLLLVTTTVLLASSLTLEQGRRSFLRGLDRSIDVLRKWLSVTLLLGLTFLGGQLMAWRVFFAQGIHLNTNAHGSFIYLMTGLHGLHVAGGILALGYLVMTLWLGQNFAAGAGSGPRIEAFFGFRVTRWLEATAIYWHFMGGLWIYLLVLLFVVR
jgi:cytochrome c oxidase subunit 3